MKEHTYAVIYVDDVLFLGKPKSKLTQELKQKFMATWECHDQGEVREFLSMTIKQDQKRKLLYLNQEQHLKTVLEKFPNFIKRKVDTPLPSGYEFETYKGNINNDF